MSERTMSEFVSIIQPIIEEYKSEIINATNKFKSDIESKLLDMNPSEASVFYAMFTNAQKEIEKIAGE